MIMTMRMGLEMIRETLCEPQFVLIIAMILIGVYALFVLASYS